MVRSASDRVISQRSPPAFVERQENGSGVVLLMTTCQSRLALISFSHFRNDRDQTVKTACSVFDVVSNE